MGSSPGGSGTGVATTTTRGQQDRTDADAVDEVGVVGVYPTASLRPLALGVGITAAVLGVVLGSWMLLAGVAIVASQVALLVRDADR